MRVKAVTIHRYGPLSGISAGDLGNFALVYGSNEEGKTLFLDALLKLLFRKELTRQIKHLGNIRRVDEHPEGFVVLSLKDGEIKLDRDTSISEHVSLSAADFRNVFVVRDSDLSVVAESEYYAQISERLAGLRTTEIDSIKKVLQEKGRLTNPSSKSELSDSIGTDHIATKVETARRFVQSIDARLPHFQDANYDGLERDMVELRDRIAKSEQEIALQRKAEVRQRYEDLRARIGELREIEAELGRLGAIKDEEWETWRESEIERDQQRSELDDTTRQLDRVGARLEETSQMVPRATARVDELEGQRKRFDDVLKPKIDACDALQRLSAEKEAHSRMWKWGIGVFLGLLALSLVGSIVRPSVIFQVAFGLFVALSGLAAWQLILFQKTNARLDVARNDLRRAARDYGLEVGSGGTFTGRDPIDAELEAARQDVREIELSRRALAESQEGLNEKISRLTSRITQIEDDIATRRAAAGVESREAYGMELRRKRELLARQKSLHTLLAGALGTASGGEATDVWERHVESRLAEKCAGSGGLEWDPARVGQLEANVKTLKHKLEDTRKALADGHTELRDFEREIRQAAILPGDEVICRTPRDLQSVGHALVRFIEGTQQRMENAKLAMSVFERIEAEERSRVVELFGRERPVSTYFRMMSRGRYDAVEYDLASGTIIVRDVEGHTVPAAALSGGAVDQLYLAIRLSIGEDLLAGERGFFLLDDPFVKSDHARLESQLGVMRKLASEGWQIVYFSAKKEVFDLLEPDIAAGRVRLLRMDRTVGRSPMRSATGGGRRPSRREGAGNLELFEKGPIY